MHIGVGSGEGGGGGYCLPISITRLLYNKPLLIIISNLPPPSPTQLLASSDTYGSFYVLFIPYVFYIGNEGCYCSFVFVLFYFLFLLKKDLRLEYL